MLSDNYKKYLVYSTVAIAILLGIFLLILSISGLKAYKYIGRGQYADNVISISGTGEVYAVPDTATFSYSVVETGSTPKDAGDKAATKANTILAVIKTAGVEEKDIQTTNYSVYPKYKTVRTSCGDTYNTGSASVSSSMMLVPPCYNSDQVVNGYEVNETFTVKVRNTDNAGSILAKVGELGAQNISGLNFVIDNPEKIEMEARDKAIADAKSKAKALSDSLGIKISKIVNFYENAGPMPVMYDSRAVGGVAEMATQAKVPQISTGQNKIVSNVTITYRVD